MEKIKRTYEISTETERGVKLMATLKGMTINEYVDSVLYESLSDKVKKLLDKQVLKYETDIKNAI